MKYNSIFRKIGRDNCQDITSSKTAVMEMKGKVDRLIDKLAVGNPSTTDAINESWFVAEGSRLFKDETGIGHQRYFL